ncbi:kinase-like domain-containing protein [Gigaspora rosea]|uniref:Kinase-like domain-containing protein n=1 Tax=Gigaspora rosea TaxID=44941 RepID=A0A397VL63_9GLOM|nr:kinase-like domain-containing protein [Gigaspora rosea]
MGWKDKLNLLQCIASDLQIIHSHDLIHRDLHSGNILLDNFKSAYIADLGLSITANIELKRNSDRICGILPYIAPEVLNNRQYTKASDIYSFGIIMWEILYGKPIPSEQQSKLQSKLQYQIQVCNEPKERPAATEICDIFAEWQNSEIILSELSKSDKKLQNIKNEDMHVYIASHYISSFISSIKSQGSYNCRCSFISSNKCQESEIYELEIPDTIDK